MEKLKVSTHSNPQNVVGVITVILKDHNFVELQAIGAGAVNQIVKAIIIARGYLAPSNIDLICILAFAAVELEYESRVAIKMTVWAER